MLLFFDSIHLGKTASSIIKFVTPNVFAVYLVNSNQRVRKYYIEGIAPILKMPILKMLAFLFLIVIGFFVVAIILDKLRVLLFDVTGINKLIRRLDNTKFNGYFN